MGEGENERNCTRKGVLREEEPFKEVKSACKKKKKTLQLKRLKGGRERKNLRGTVV